MVPITLLILLLIGVLVVLPGLTLGRGIGGSAWAGLGISVVIMAISCAFTAAVVGLVMWAQA